MIMIARLEAVRRTSEGDEGASVDWVGVLVDGATLEPREGLTSHV